jgi:hypothetical protein
VLLLDGGGTLADRLSGTLGFAHSDARPPRRQLLVAQRERWLQTADATAPRRPFATTAGFGRSAWLTLIFGEGLRSRGPGDLRAGVASSSERCAVQVTYLRAAEFRFERGKGPAPWGAYQPKFERLVTDGEHRYFLEGRLRSGEPVRVQLTTAGFRTRPGS